ncbi:DNA-methyltransferase [Paenibacillus agricola]|uniref:Methyltransferase n=1 Tax=Paenibacillus agricola TaxID=2716264 RepID=A0ABX0J436_9BACL|nr:site-specific DNA-methyltransferase [Paenibacillus agricola]NHN31147.1 site-specific DNA-methyltransferase [Paenibacillus agricola]
MTKKLLGDIELNRIYQRDCIEGMRMIPSETVDLAIVDPPYGINFHSNYRKSSMLKTTGGIANDGIDNAGFLAVVIDEIYRVLKPNAHIYWFTRWDKVTEQQPLLERQFTVKNSLIWMKNNWSMGDLFGAYAGQYENILFAQKGRRLLNEVDGRTRHADILQFDRISPNKLRHSHEKPEGLIEFLIRKSSAVGDVILTPFCGSGTDCVAAAKTGRDFISFELDADHITTANKRLDSIPTTEVNAI